MYCQECRVPLKLDGSLQDLNPTAYDILVGAHGKSLSDRLPSTHSSRPITLIPQERKELYDHVSQKASTPRYKKTVSSAAQQSQSQNAAGMSFVVLSDSQIDPPDAAQTFDGSTKPSGSKDGRAKQDGSSKGKEASEEDEGKRLAKDLEKANRLFDILSSRSDIDHPICTECTDMLVEKLSKRLQTATQERDSYIKFLKNLNSSIPSEEDVKNAQAELDATLAAEDEAFKELLALEKQHADVDLEILELEDEASELGDEIEKFWVERNAFEEELHEIEEAHDAAQVRYERDKEELDLLQRTNVYYDAFCIGHDGLFGTINGLRLGRLPNENVEWTEVNAAWGQCALLLATLADRLGYKFKGYKLIPLGSRSKILKLEYPPPKQNTGSIIMNAVGGAGTVNSARAAANARRGRADTPPAQAQQNEPPEADSNVQPKTTTCDLFFSSDLPGYLPWVHRRFDNGMVAFLDCLKQLCEHVDAKIARSTSSAAENTETPPREPISQRYKIDRDKIRDASIRIGLKQTDETWTRACKYTLTCCKYLLAYVSNHSIAGHKKRESTTDTSAEASRKAKGKGKAAD